MKSAGRYAFSLSVIAAIVYLIDANDILATMVSADHSTLMVAIGFALSSQIFSAMRLYRLAVLQGLPLTFFKTLLIGLSATYYGLVVPGGTVAAFVVRFIQLSQKAPVESVAATLIVDRVVATAFLIAIGVIAIAFDQAEPRWAIALAAGTFLAVGVFVFGRRLFLHMVDSLEYASNRNSPSRLHEIVGRVGRAFLMYSDTGMGQMLIIAVATLLAHLCGCLVYFTIARSLDLNLTLLSMCWIRSAMILFSMIPVSVGGLGLREVAAVAILVPLGFGEAHAVGFSIMVFLVTPFTVGLIGSTVELCRIARLT